MSNSTANITFVMRLISELEKAYTNVLEYCCLGRTTPATVPFSKDVPFSVLTPWTTPRSGRGSYSAAGLAHLLAKLHTTVKKLGTGALLDDFVEWSYKTTSASTTSTLGTGSLHQSDEVHPSSSIVKSNANIGRDGFRTALRRYILRVNDNDSGSDKYSGFLEGQNCLFFGSSDPPPELSVQTDFDCLRTDGSGVDLGMFSKESRDVRRLIGWIASNANRKSIDLVELMWKEVLAEWILRPALIPTLVPTYHPIGNMSQRGNQTGVCTPTAGPPTTPGLMFNPTNEAEIAAISSSSSTYRLSEGLISVSSQVDLLFTRLQRAREASLVDLSALENCSLTAEAALAIAVRRMPRNEAVELAKTLAVRLSTVMDVSKQDPYRLLLNMSSRNFSSSMPVESGGQIPNADSTQWESIVSQLCDLVRVCYDQSSTDFAHFYEVLLARRLLQSRYLSIEKEKQILRLLPALNKSDLMIR